MAELFADLRSPQTGGACTKCAHFDACRGGCMAAKFFTGLPLDGPDPECVQGYGESALAALDRGSPDEALAVLMRAYGTAWTAVGVWLARLDRYVRPPPDSSWSIALWMRSL